MGLSFVLGRSGNGKSTYILNRVKEIVQSNETTPVIVIVPEQYTFEMEKRMSRLFLKEMKDKYLRARILSFKTLNNIISSRVGGLTDVNINSSGKAMITYQAIDKVNKDLKIYSKSASQSGFVSSISEIISEMKQYSVSPEMLENISYDVENETLKLKIEDISKIYKAFEDNLHENYVDSQDMLNSLADKIQGCNYLDGAYIFVDEFTGFTPNQYRVLRSLLNKAKEVCISLTVDAVNSIKYNKSDVFSRTKFTYEKLNRLCSEENIKITSHINLNNTEIKRFKGNRELQHLERFYNTYPYKTYEDNTNCIKINEYKNLYSEIEEIAKEIIYLVREREIRYKDITIATRDLKRYSFLINSIFDEYNIPCFIDEKREAKSNPIITLLISALEMKTRRYSYETMFRYLKSGLIGISSDEISLLENYVISNGIYGKKWFEDKWEYRVDHNYSREESEYELELKDRINDIKNKVISPITILQNKVKGKNSSEHICKSIYEFLVDINIPNTIESLVNKFKYRGELDIASQYSQVWDIVVDILDQIVEIIGSKKITLDEFIKLISLGFDEYELGIVPPSIDQVLVSSIDRMKNPNTRYLYLVGTTDGIFPLISKDNGLLSDKDRDKLDKLGVEVDIDSKTKTFEEQFLVYKALTSTCENLIISYPISDHEGKTLRPSVIVSRLKKIFPKISNNSYLICVEPTSDEEILKSISTKSPTFNLLINEIKYYEEKNYISNVWLDLYKYYINEKEYKSITKKVVEGLGFTNQVFKVEENKIKKLYQNNLLSVSRLEKYASCPFAYFIQYGLKAKERKEYSFSAPDLGIFIHNILERFSKSLEEDNLNWREINSSYIEKKVFSIVDNLISKIPGYILQSSDRYKYLSHRLKNMLVSAINIISEQIKQGSFNPTDYEVEFGVKSKYPPIKIILNNGEEINLIGQIDRLDEYEEEDNRYIRIVDYKSSNKSINLSDIYYGLQLQLLVYLDAILESNKENTCSLSPAAILYSRIDDPIAKFSEDKEDDEVREAILKEVRMKGLIIKDPKLIKEMDKSLASGERSTSLVIPANLTKDGSVGKNTTGVTFEEFDILRKYVKQVIKDICEDMVGGNIMIAPYKNKNSISCDYCNYSSICQFDVVLKDNNYRLLNDKKNDEILNLMKGETD